MVTPLSMQNVAQGSGRQATTPQSRDHKQKMTGIQIMDTTMGHSKCGNCVPLSRATLSATVGHPDGYSRYGHCVTGQSHHRSGHCMPHNRSTAATSQGHKGCAHGAGAGHSRYGHCVSKGHDHSRYGHCATGQGYDRCGHLTRPLCQRAGPQHIWPLCTTSQGHSRCGHCATEWGHSRCDHCTTVQRAGLQ